MHMVTIVSFDQSDNTIDHNKMASIKLVLSDFLPITYPKEDVGQCTWPIQSCDHVKGSYQHMSVSEQMLTATVTKL